MQPDDHSTELYGINIERPLVHIDYQNIVMSVDYISGLNNYSNPSCFFKCKIMLLFNTHLMQLVKSCTKQFRF